MIIILGLNFEQILKFENFWGYLYSAVKGEILGFLEDKLPRRKFNTAYREENRKIQ